MAEATLTNNTMNEKEVEKLWEAFKVFDTDGSGSVCAKELGEVLRSLGHSPTDQQVREMVKEVDVDGSGTIDFEEFKALMVSKQGDRESRLRLAFSVFDEDGSGQITAKELRNVMSQFGLTEEELDAMIKEVDSDGDASIDFEEFCQLVPEETTSEAVYQDSPDMVASESLQAPPPPPKMSEAADTTDAEGGAPPQEIQQLKELLDRQVEDEKSSRSRSGTSRLQMQIGLFRLIQGASYRCFRESFSANHETHLRVKDLPYRISDFVKFVRVAIALYKALGIVEAACHPLLDDVVSSLEAEYARLQDRIQNWKTIEKTPEMLAEEKRVLEERGKSESVRSKFAAGVEFAITMKKKHLSLSNVVEGVLAINELNRLRQMELNAELAPPPQKSGEPPQAYLKKWNRVILDSAGEKVDGAMMPVAYWYEEFAPKLLAAFSVATAADIQSNTVPDEAELDRWYEETKAKGSFERYGGDVRENFLKCTPKQKLAIKQAWRLTYHYLNGVQKRRERAEFGRESGALSQYVAFLDAYLDRTDIRDAGMRVSFPYYIGPGVWRFFHTTAEILCTQPLEAQKAAIPVFRDFFKLFATMYPCPYCRHHLNAYVVQNKEVDMYPMEYLILGREPRGTEFRMSIEDKIATVSDGPSMRLFFWKLHNTVNSSIARSEEWFHQDDKAFYTTRYWPSLDSELARARALRHITIATDRIYRIYGLLKPAAHLSGLRSELQRLLDKADEAGVREACNLAEEYIKELENAVLEGGFLQEAYRFDPAATDAAPYFTPEEEEFARSGVFVMN